MDRAEIEFSAVFYVFSAFRALFTGPVSILFKKNFKIGSHDTIYIFKNYFTIVFLVFSNKRYLNRLYKLCIELKEMSESLVMHARLAMIHHFKSLLSFIHALIYSILLSVS